MSYLSDCTRVYTPTGQLAHLLRPGENPNDDLPALCRRRPLRRTTWHGTGSQDEYDKAAALPLCSRCEHLAGAR